MTKHRDHSPAIDASSDGSAVALAEVVPAEVALAEVAPVEMPAASHDEDVSVDEQIRVRAYELYLERRDQPGDHGDHLDDWLRAEREYRERSVEQLVGRETGQEPPAR
jgi:hypothetical protein